MILTGLGHLKSTYFRGNNTTFLFINHKFILQVTVPKTFFMQRQQKIHCCQNQHKCVSQVKSQLYL